MRTSTAGSRMSFCTWMFRGLGIYFVLEFGSFFLLRLALKKTAAELAVPYLAFAAPGAVLLAFVWWLRRREEQGVSPKRLARRWGVSVALWGVATVVAIFYSGVKLGFMDPSNAIGGLVVSVLLSVPIGYFTLYHLVITRLSSRVAAKGDSTCPK